MAEEIIDAISDFRDDAVVYGMQLEENEGYARDYDTAQFDKSIRKLAEKLGVSEFCRIENGYIYKNIQKPRPNVIRYGVHPKGWTPELEEKIRRRGG